MYFKVLCENRFFQMVGYFQPFAESDFGDAAERGEREERGEVARKSLLAGRCLAHFRAVTRARL